MQGQGAIRASKPDEVEGMRRAKEASGAAGICYIEPVVEGCFF